jgi:hypothetical protein
MSNFTSFGTGPIMMAEKKPERKDREAGKQSCWPGGFGAYRGPIHTDLDLETNQDRAPSG